MSYRQESTEHGRVEATARKNTFEVLMSFSLVLYTSCVIQRVYYGMSLGLGPRGFWKKANLAGAE